MPQTERRTLCMCATRVHCTCTCMCAKRVCVCLHVYCMHPSRSLHCARTVVCSVVHTCTKFNISTKSYLMNHKIYFSQSLHHLKDLELCHISFTDMTPIWPLLPVETESLIEKNILKHYSFMHVLCTVQLLRNLAYSYTPRSPATRCCKLRNTLSH